LQTNHSEGNQDESPIKMLPPVDSAVLERNPNFDVLYKDPDGSTRDTKKQRIYGEIRQVSQGTGCFQMFTHMEFFLPPKLT
jgi:hypothetical protein